MMNSAQKNSNIFLATAEFLKYGIDYRHLIWRKSRIKLHVQFKRSWLGSFWIFFTPISTVLVWLFLHGAGVVSAGNTGAPYVIYLLAGVTVFHLFSGVYDTVSKSITDNTNLILDVTIPPQIFILEKVVIGFLRFCMMLLVAVAVMFLFGYRFPVAALLTPLFLLPLFFTAVALGTIFSLLRVLLFDLSMLNERLVTLLIFITPVFYAKQKQFTLLARVVDYNPFTYLVCIPRDVMLFGTLPSWSMFALLLTVSFVFLIIALHIFDRSSRMVMEKLLV